MQLPALLLLSLPGYFSIQGPVSVTGRERGLVTVKCRYNPVWETSKKWWCRGASWRKCRILVQTQGSEKSGRVSIRDIQRDHLFEVTMEKLRRDDADTYWCGIERTGTDLGWSVEVIVDPANTPSKPLARSTANNIVEISSGSFKRTHYMLLVFVKVPILLILAGAVLWLKGPQRTPRKQWGQSLCKNVNSDLLTQDMAP